MSKRAIFRTAFAIVLTVFIYSFVLPPPRTARPPSKANACINNLRLIDGAKEQWANDKGKSTNASPTWEDIRPYMGLGPSGNLPTCPSKGSYTLGRVDQLPTCTIPNHELPRSPSSVRSDPATKMVP